MLRELLEAGPDDLDLYDLLGPGDYSQVYECPWCGEEFTADGDTMALICYYERYGCGCVPEEVLDAAQTNGIADADIRGFLVEWVDQSSPWDERKSQVWINGAGPFEIRWVEPMEWERERE